MARPRKSNGYGNEAPAAKVDDSVAPDAVVVGEDGPPPAERLAFVKTFVKTWRGTDAAIAAAVAAGAEPPDAIEAAVLAASYLNNDVVRAMIFSIIPALPQTEEMIRWLALDAFCRARGSNAEAPLLKMVGAWNGLDGGKPIDIDETAPLIVQFKEMLKEREG